jgi:hypothetical protein
LLDFAKILTDVFICWNTYLIEVDDPVTAAAIVELILWVQPKSYQNSSNNHQIKWLTHFSKTEFSGISTPLVHQTLEDYGKLE